MAFRITPNVDVQRDSRGRVQQLSHLFEPYLGRAGEAADGLALVTAYLRDVADIYAIDKAWLVGIGNKPADKPDDSGTELRLAEQKELHGTVTTAFAQTHRGVPIWEAGLAVVSQGTPPRITSSHSTLHDKIDLAPQDSDAAFSPMRLDTALLARALGLSQRQGKGLKIHSRRWRILRYEEDERLHPEVHTVGRKGRAKSSPPPTLPLPKPTGVEEGRHYLVTEVMFALPQPRFADLNWRAFLEVREGSVLYLRALVACADAQVFSTDPQSRSNDPAVVATATNAVLNPWRRTGTLPGLTAPPAGSNQALTGEFVQVSDVELPTVAPPTEPVGSNFNYDARSDHFAASNAYFLVDGMFRIMQSMGFTIAGAGGYFDGTSFPVPVDHRAENGAVNAHCYGDTAGDGIGRFTFGPCVAGTTVGMCTEFQTVAHEFGHALLHDSVHSANFGFSHSAGDSLAVILNDPASAVTGAARFQVFPWCPIGGAAERFCNRDVAAGWAWGGTQDDRGYGSEEILATSLFRAYQVTGGDSNHPDITVRRATKQQAARYASYLIFRSIGALATSPVTATPNVGIYATGLMNADTGTTSFDGFPGGTHNKVLRWTFERQGWYQLAGAATPVTTAGAAPDVDVYIDDGRAGSYAPYLENFWETTDIWNLTAANPATTPADHTTPVLGVTNYLYVRVRNRGTQAANNVVVRAFHNRPSTGLMWPGDWDAMTTPVLPAPGSPALSIPSLGTTIVGPFEWTPRIRGHECLLAWVTADGDRANIDPATGFPCAAGPTPHWRFVPFDNNVAQRNVAPVPGGRTEGLISAFKNREFWVENPLKETARIRVEVMLPPLLLRRGWKAVVRETNESKGWVTLKAGEKRALRISLQRGQDFTAEDVIKAKPTARRIRVRTIAAGVVTGGLSYELDARLKQPAKETRR